MSRCVGGVKFPQKKTMELFEETVKLLLHFFRNHGSNKNIFEVNPSKSAKGDMFRLNDCAHVQSIQYISRSPKLNTWLLLGEVCVLQSPHGLSNQVFFPNPKAATEQVHVNMVYTRTVQCDDDSSTLVASIRTVKRHYVFPWPGQW